MRFGWILSLLLTLSVFSTPAIAGGGHHCDHASDAPHHAVTHSHTHTQPTRLPAGSHDHEETTLCAPETDPFHHDCCGNHDHEPDQLGQGLAPRPTELPVSSVGVVQTYPTLVRAETNDSGIWPPLWQRPPDYLARLRPIVMLN